MAPQPSDDQPYVVREGDTLTVLAYRRGADATAIWNDPSNAGLKASRCSMDLLHPGDIVHLPPARETFTPVSVGAVNEFRAPPAVWQPYPAVVLAQSSANPNIANVLIRAMMPSSPTARRSSSGPWGTCRAP